VQLQVNSLTCGNPFSKSISPTGGYATLVANGFTSWTVTYP
jgi:hypothetical protein